MVRLISPYFSTRDLNRYLKRQRCSPQPGMRRAVRTRSGFECWSYEQYEWSLHSVTADRRDAVAWWLGDPWLPDNQFEYGVLADGGGPDAAAGPDSLLQAADSGPWSPVRWEAAATAIAARVAHETSVSPRAVGPESAGAEGGVYQRMLRDEIAGDTGWTASRRRSAAPRGHCFVRIDLPDPLRCVVLSEAMVLLNRRPHVSARIAIEEPPNGVAAQAARIMTEFGLPKSAFHLLVR